MRQWVAMSDGVPPALAAAWGLRPRPARGPRPSLSLDRIVAAAVALADAGGLGAVSMSKIAQELGTAPMSLYRYVSSKDELFALMIDAAAGAPPAPASPEDGWRGGLARWAWNYLGLLRQHRWIVRVPINTPPTSPGQIAWLESGLLSLRGTALTSVERLSTMTMLSAYVRSWAQLTDDIAAAAAAAGSTSYESMEAYSRMLLTLIGDRFPETAAVMADNLAVSPDEPPDADFEFGLSRQLDGLETLMRSRASTVES